MLVACGFRLPRRITLDRTFSAVSRPYRPPGESLVVTLNQELYWEVLGERRLGGRAARLPLYLGAQREGGYTEQSFRPSLIGACAAHFVSEMHMLRESKPVVSIPWPIVRVVVGRDTHPPVEDGSTRENSSRETYDEEPRWS